MTDFNLGFKDADDVLKVCHISLLLQLGVEIGAIDLALESVSYGGLISLHLQTLVDLVRIGLSIEQRRNVVEVFLHGAILQLLHHLRVHVLDLRVQRLH